MDKHTSFTTISDKVRIRLLVFMANIEVKLEDCINSHLAYGVKCHSLTGDSVSRIIKLAHGLGLVDGQLCNNLLWLNKRRNEVAHNKPIEFELNDFPRLQAMLPDVVVKHLESRRDTREGHYIALLDALDEFLNQTIFKKDKNN